MGIFLSTGILIALLFGFISLGAVYNSKSLRRAKNEHHDLPVGRYREETNAWLRHR